MWVVIPTATGKRRCEDLNVRGKPVTKDHNARVCSRWWQMSIAEVRLDSKRDEGMRTEMKTRWSMGHGCPKMHAKERAGKQGRFACYSARPGDGIYMTLSPTQRDKYATSLVSRKKKKE